MAQDYYSTLGVSKAADSEDIKKAYRKMAMKYHPDRNKGDTEAEKTFKKINEAYEVLSDVQKKAAYDRYGDRAFKEGGFNQSQYNQQASQNAGGFHGGFDFDDIINDFFGQRSTSHRSTRNIQPGSDIRFDVTITLEEAYEGKSTEIKFRTYCKCDSCNGSGNSENSRVNYCNVCGGAGVIRTQQGFFHVEKTCYNCQGRGHIVSNPCKACSGSGRFFKEKKLNLKIPRGVDEGTKIRLASEGEAGVSGAPCGDLYIFVSVKNHQIFKREGKDLLCKVPISFSTAALGNEIQVSGIDKTPLSLKIPHGTQTNHQFRLKGKGMPVLQSMVFGDLLVEVIVETPVKLTKVQKELLQNLEESGKNSENNPMASGFFAKVKEFFGEK